MWTRTTLALAHLVVAGLTACGDDVGTDATGGSGGSGGAASPATSVGSGLGSTAASTASSSATSAPASSSSSNGVGGSGDGGQSAGGNGGTGGAGGGDDQLVREAPETAQPDDAVGASVAISADGTVIAVGATGDSNPNGGIGPDPGSSDLYLAGAVYVYEAGPDGWTSTYIKPELPERAAFFGSMVALSADGSTLAVGAPSEGGGPELQIGAVHVFTRDGESWLLQQYIPSPSDDDDFFGHPLALSRDGDTLLVGASGDDSGVAGDPDSNVAIDAGAAYVFVRSAGSWEQQAYLQAPDIDTGNRFAESLALSGDGSVAAIGVPYENSDATGIDGDDAGAGATESGAVYVFVRSGDTWSVDTFVKASNTGEGDLFAWSVDLSSDGTTLVVGAPNEASGDAGVDADQDDDTLPGAGAIYVFDADDGVWSQSAYIKSPVPYEFGAVGGLICLSGDGATLTSNDGDLFAGGQRIWRRTGDAWTYEDTIFNPSGSDGFQDAFGADTDLSDDGNLLVVGAPHDSETGTFSLFDLPD